MIYSYHSDIPELILTVTGEQVVESDCGLQGKDMGRTKGHYQITRPALLQALLQVSRTPRV